MRVAGQGNNRGQSVASSDDDQVELHETLHNGPQPAHRFTSARSSEWAQASRSASTALSITARPLSSMRNETSRVHRTRSRAAKLDCLAIWITQTTDAYIIETTT